MWIGQRDINSETIPGHCFPLRWRLCEGHLFWGLMWWRTIHHRLQLIKLQLTPTHTSVWFITCRQRIPLSCHQSYPHSSKKKKEKKTPVWRHRLWGNQREMGHGILISKQFAVSWEAPLWWQWVTVGDVCLSLRRVHCAPGARDCGLETWGRRGVQLGGGGGCSLGSGVVASGGRPVGVAGPDSCSSLGVTSRREQHICNVWQANKRLKDHYHQQQQRGWGEVGVVEGEPGGAQQDSHQQSLLR